MRLALMYHQLRPAGGLEGYLFEFARRLSAAGHEIDWVTGRIDADTVAALPGRVHLVQESRASALLRLWQFDQRAPGVAASLGADRVLGFGRTARQDIHRAGGGCHAEYSRLLPPWKRWGLKNMLELRLERRLYSGNGTARFVTNSSAVARQLRGWYGTPEDRFTTIHTAVDGAVFDIPEDRAAARAAVRAHLKTDEDAAVLLFVSLSHRRKGLDTLLRALARTPGPVLWVVGKGLGRAHLAQVAALGLGNRIRVVPATRQLNRLYQAADWFVHPTLYDACANTVLQAWSCGLPALISARDGVIDLLREGENGFLIEDPLDAEALAVLMREALRTGGEDWERMSLTARATTAGLTWERHVAAWEALLAAGPP